MRFRQKEYVEVCYKCDCNIIFIKKDVKIKKEEEEYTDIEYVRDGGIFGLLGMRSKVEVKRKREHRIPYILCPNCNNEVVVDCLIDNER